MYQSRGILNIPPRGTAGSNFSTASTGAYPTTSCPSQIPPPELNLAWYYGVNATNPDVTVCYSRPAGVPVSDPRRGYYLDVETWYHLQVFIPLLQQFLPDDPVKGSPWIRLPGRITVVVNYPDNIPGVSPAKKCADRNCRVSVEASAPFVPLPSQYLLNGAFQITLRGGSQLVIQR